MARADTILQRLNQLSLWGLLTTDTELVITNWNDWLARNSGHPATEIVGRSLLAAYPEIVSADSTPSFTKPSPAK